jgi:hypothetical protein
MESNNHLSSELKELEKDMLKIQIEYELESRKLDNEYNVKMRQLDLIEKLIDKIDKIEIEIKVYQDKEGLTSSSVIESQTLGYQSSYILFSYSYSNAESNISFASI